MRKFTVPFDLMTKEERSKGYVAKVGTPVVTLNGNASKRYAFNAYVYDEENSAMIREYTLTYACDYARLR